MNFAAIYTVTASLEACIKTEQGIRVRSVKVDIDCLFVMEHGKGSIKGSCWEISLREIYDMKYETYIFDGFFDVILCLRNDE